MKNIFVLSSVLALAVAQQINLVEIRHDLMRQRVAPEEVITWKSFDQPDQESTKDGADKRMLWDIVRHSKRQPANLTTINWDAVPDQLLQKLIKHDKMPKQGIPKTAWSSGPWKPDHFEPLAKQYMPENSTINFLSYDEMEKSIEEMSKELEKIEVFGAKKAYDMIRARSYKSDFWRWMTLWSKGGVYIDAKYGFEIPVEKWVSFENDEFIMCPCLRATMNTPLIVATQYHPIALFMVQDMIKNSNERLYYSSDLDTTGPGAVRKLVNATGMATHYNLRCWMKHNMKMDLYMAESDTSMIGEEEKQYLIVKENPYHQDIHAMMNKCTTCNSYHQLYKDHQVYCDQPGTPCDGKNYTEWQDDNSHFNSANKSQGLDFHFINSTAPEYNPHYYDHVLGKLAPSPQSDDFDKFDKLLKQQLKYDDMLYDEEKKKNKNFKEDAMKFYQKIHQKEAKSIQEQLNIKLQYLSQEQQGVELEYEYQMEFEFDFN